MRSLRQCLLDADLSHLRVIARFWGVEPTPKRQRELALLLTQKMPEREAVLRSWRALPEDQRTALESLLAAGGRAPRRVLARRWGDIHPVGPGRMERERPWRNPGSPLEGLWYSGFIFRAFAAEDEGSHEELFVPQEVMIHLQAKPASTASPAIEPAGRPAVVLAAEDALLDDACTLLSYVQNHRLRPEPQLGWPDHHERQLVARLRAPNSTRLALLRHVAASLGWLQTAESGHLRLDPGPVTTWLKQRAGLQRATLAAAWLDDAEWNDLRHVPGLAVDETGAWHNDPLRARRAIQRHLSACEAGTWYGIADFVAAIKDADPDFQRPDGDYSSWYIRDFYSGHYLSGFECWDRVEGALVRFLITGPLDWLGLVELGLEGDSCAPTSFRLTEAGAEFISGGEPPPDPPAPRPVARPDLTIEIPASRRYERFQLGRVADWARSGERYAYRISGGSLQRAKQQGISVKRVLEFLREATEQPLPHSVEQAVKAWEKSGSQARLEQLIVLRLADEKLMERILATPSTRNLVQERIGPSAALVRKRDWKRLVTALAEMGLLSDVVGIDDDAAGS